MANEPKLSLDNRVLLVGTNTGEDHQRLEPTAQSLFDFVDENKVPLNGRVEPNIDKFLEEHKQKFPAAGGFGIRGEPQVDPQTGAPVATQPSFPRLAVSAGSGIVKGATINLVNLPDLPEETTTERMVRGLGQVVGAGLAFGMTRQGVLLGGRLLGRQAGRKTLAVAGAGLGFAESRTDPELQPSVARDIFAAGLTGAFMALAGPARVADDLRNIMLRDPAAVTARYRGLPSINKVLNRARLKDIPEDERELARMWQAFGRHIAPGEIQFDDLVNVTRRVRAGEKVSDDLVVAPIDTPGLARILKGSGLTDKEVSSAFSVPLGPKSRLPIERQFTSRFGAVGRQPDEFSIGRFGRVEATTPTDTPSVTTPGLSIADDGASRITNIRKGLDGEKGKAALTSTRATEQAASARPARAVSSKQAIDDIVESGVSGSADRPLLGTVTTPSGRVLTEGEALARRGKPKLAAALGSVERQVVGSGGIARTSVRYINKETKEEVGRAVYVRLKPTKEGAQVVGTNEVIPSEAGKADFLIEVFNPAPGFSEAIVMDLRAAGGRFIRGSRPGIKGLSRRLGGRPVEGTDDIIEFENLIVPRGGAPSDDVLRIGDALKGVGPKKQPMPRGVKISSIRPQAHVFSDIEEVFRDSATGISQLPLRTEFFNVIENAKLAAAKASTVVDEEAASIFRVGLGGLTKGTSRATRRDMMDFLAGTPQQRLGAAGRLSAQDKAKTVELKNKIFDPLAQRWFGTNSDDLFNRIIPAHRKVNNTDPKVAFALDEPSSQGFNSLLRFSAENNAINPLEKDLARFTASLIRTGFHKEFVAAPLREARKLVDSRNFPEGVRSFAASYLKGVDGTESRFVDNFGGLYQRMFRAVGHEVPADDVRNIITGFTALTHAGLMGFRIGPLIRNATAGLTVTAPRIGTKWYVEGLKQSLTPKGVALFKSSGIAEEQATILDALNAVSRAPISGGIQRIAKTSLAPYSKIDQFPRAHAFLGMRARVLDTAKRLGPNAPDEQILRQAGMYRFHPVHHPEFLRDFKGGFFEEAARTAGIIANQDTQWIYRQGFRPQLLASEGGRFFGTFGIWPTNYLEYLRQMKDIATGRWPGVPKDEAARWLGEWAATNLAVVATFAGAGATVGIGAEALQHTLGWTFLSPIAYDGGPALDLFRGMAGMIVEMQQGRMGQHTAEVARSFGILVPGQAALNDFLQTQGKQFQASKGVTRRARVKPARSAGEALFRAGTGVQRRR